MYTRSIKTRMELPVTRTASAQALPLPSLIRAAAWDEGNRSMSRGRRTKWSRKDYVAACEKQHQLVRQCFGEGDTGFLRFGVAEQLEKAGVLALGMKAKAFYAEIEAHMEA